MGQQYVAEAPTFNWTVHGTQKISSVTLYSIKIEPNASVETLQEWALDETDPTGSFVYAWDGGDRAVRIEVVQVSEPLFDPTD